MTDAELLAAAIQVSGMSARRFARDVLTRDPRTVFRWLRGPHTTDKGELVPNALPHVVRDRLEQLVKLPAPTD